MRATVFHLGMLSRLARDRLLEEVSFVSSVSGGSLAVGLLYANNRNRWPTSCEFDERIAPEARTLLTRTGTQRSYVWHSLALPWRLFRGRAHILAGILRDKWGISGDLNELPAKPRWFINATCFETGKNWRFGQTRMGDYETNYVLEPAFSIADAVAASAAVPGAIGPLILRSKSYRWHRYVNGKLVEVEPRASRYDLWDGGVYDNLGLEPLVKISGGSRAGVDFLIVSDASARLELAPKTLKRSIRPAHRTVRLVDIATDQVRALRARALVGAFATDPTMGAYIHIGNTTAGIYREAGGTVRDVDVLCDEDVASAATMKTTLRRLSEQEYDRLFRHGFEVADATLSAWHPSRFEPLPYNPGAN